jgi:hypothetical protein
LILKMGGRRAKKRMAHPFTLQPITRPSEG